MPTEQTARRIVLLGPQRLQPTLKEAARDLGIEGRIAAVTAGWEEREQEDQELSQHLGGRIHNLDLHRRLEAVLTADSELREGMRERYRSLRRLQELYRLRLSYAMDGARELLRREGDDAAIEAVRADAIESVRRIDALHEVHVLEALETYRERYRPDEREGVAREREALQRELESCEALCIAGGHVAVLLNRLRAFRVVENSGTLPILAWSAGAMVISEHIVLFHDNPPQGFGNAEVHQPGLGVARGIVPLPHAKRRLWLHDPARVALFARRFEPALCVTLDEGARVDWDGTTWVDRAGAQRLSVEGGLADLTHRTEVGLS